MSVLKMMLSSVGLTPESGAAYVSESLGRQISENTLRTMMRSKTSVPADVVNCLKERHDAIEEASRELLAWIEDPERDIVRDSVLIPHTHNKDTDVQKLALAKAMFRSSRKCSISQK